jgi:CRP-like cAMP-binding protein
MNKDRYNFTQILQKLDTFRGLDIAEAKLVLQVARQRSFKAGEIIWNVGEESSDMLVLVSGDLVITSPEGMDIAEVLPGASFGEMGLITGHPRFVGVRASKPSIALSITHLAVRQLKAENKDLMIKILENIVDLLAHRLTHTKHEHYRRSTPTDRDAEIW